MATKKIMANAKLVDAGTEAIPINPALTWADRAYLRGLKRRGFTEAEIIGIGKKAGFTVTPDDLKPKAKVVTKVG